MKTVTMIVAAALVAAGCTTGDNDEPATGAPTPEPAVTESAPDAEVPRGAEPAPKSGPTPASTKSPESTVLSNEEVRVALLDAGDMRLVSGLADSWTSHASTPRPDSGLGAMTAIVDEYASDETAACAVAYQQFVPPDERFFGLGSVMLDPVLEEQDGYFFQEDVFSFRPDTDPAELVGALEEFLADCPAAHVLKGQSSVDPVIHNNGDEFMELGDKSTALRMTTAGATIYMSVVVRGQTMLSLYALDSDGEPGLDTVRFERATRLAADKLDRLYAGELPGD